MVIDLEIQKMSDEWRRAFDDGLCLHDFDAAWVEDIGTNTNANRDWKAHWHMSSLVGVDVTPADHSRALSSFGWVMVTFWC